ncbi:MAG TPA: lysine--tRNA ligase [Candidatus Paceibacterota bacterium]|jgi:lysyl-tRNA synthetase class 2|nr:lysine--tRNA ligase [Candidatus Paceibacterota bacterium]HPC37475.1 lysine--tRNA ligase [Candidatus Paceibacterota bacterium]HRU36021.1 lysine--tRNA ligase [Candidatus Paceibacterota bacterium]
MSTADEIKKIRIKKIEELKKDGKELYPSHCFKNKTISDILKNFSSFSKQKKNNWIAGRIMNMRFHGGIAFIDLRDESGELQIVIKKENIKDFDSLEKYLDSGDFIEVRGYPFKTKRGEKSLLVKEWRIISKSLRPLPSEWYGLKDSEERFRKRYLDLILNQDVKKRFELRSLIIKTMRDFFNNKGFLEVETPILQTLAGGATARPFKTRLDTLNIPLYLRIAPELYLKKLIVGGFEKIYEIGKNFRNEGIDKTHNPEFTMLELYWAYADYQDMMGFIEDLLVYILKNALPKTKNPLLVNYNGQLINFTPPYPKVNFLDIIKEEMKVDPLTVDEKNILSFLQNKGVDITSEMRQYNKWELFDEVYKKVHLEKMIQPTFIIHHPVALSPLAKLRKENNEETERFQLVVGGIECVNGYSELNDPIDQARRFKIQEKRRKAGNKEAPQYNSDFVEALEYGMPPTAGVGIGIDRLVMILTNAPSVKEVIFFPFMRNK